MDPASPPPTTSSTLTARPSGPIAAACSRGLFPRPPLREEYPSGPERGAGCGRQGHSLRLHPWILGGVALEDIVEDGEEAWVFGEGGRAGWELGSGAYGEVLRGRGRWEEGQDVRGGCGGIWEDILVSGVSTVGIEPIELGCLRCED
jgi:hypothetical protein